MWHKHRLDFVQQVSQERKAWRVSRLPCSYKICGFVVTLQN